MTTISKFGWAALLAALALAPVASHADDHDDDGEHREARRERKPRGLASGTAAARATPGWKIYESECGSCHLAYPPGLLPAESWTTMLSKLDDHFGQNAEVDAATAKELGAFLSTWAAPRREGSPPPARITGLAWWQHEHDEISAGVWQRKAVGSKSNCTACHLNADQGEFDEHRVKIPKDATPAR